MAHKPMSGPDPSKSVPSSGGVLREQPDDPKFKTNFADLAARFSSMSGGGLSPSSSADLALEIVLNEIVEQACLATGATGAAIVLEREGEMVCRATSGASAPELGSKLDMTTGLAGECFSTHRTQWCDDAASDLRADVVGSARQGVRSMVMMPLLRDSKLLGVIELFSEQPYAFGLRDERTLEVLADRTVNNLEHAARPQEAMPPPLQTPAAGSLPAITPLQDLPWQDESKEAQPFGAGSDAHSEAPPAINPLESFITEFPPKRVVPRRRPDTVTSLLNASVLVCAILVGLVVGRQWGAKHASQRTRPALTTSVSAAAPVKPAPGPETSAKSDSAHLATQTAAMPPVKQAAPAVVAPIERRSPDLAAKARVKAASTPVQTEAQVPPGGLSVFENGKEVFRMPPSGPPRTIVDQREAATPARTRVDQPEAATAVKPAAAIESESVELSPEAAEDSLVQRVEPDYPEAARQKKIQGTVVLDVEIGPDGLVEGVQAQSGPPLLAQAASDAVKQWKFQPHMLNGHAVKARTKTTLSFILPKQ